MDRERFDNLLAAYGGDFRRWPAEERAGAALFAVESAEAAAALKEAQTLDSALDQARGEPDTSALAARILAQAPRGDVGFDRRALLALAACAVFGIVLGYGGGMLAPADVDDGYFSAAFEAPLLIGDEG
jgi:hypothetical protein